jgi:uncharacterized protein (UPF0332 family)
VKRDDEINYWRDKGNRSLKSAKHSIGVGNLDFAVSGIYYAMFYEVTALLLTKDLKFKTHAGVRTTFNREYAKTGIVSQDMGDFYNDIFDLRFDADYQPFVEFEKEEVQEWLEQAEKFIEEIEGII